MAWNGFVKVSNLGWCPDGSGTNTKLYEPVSQIACVSVSIFLILIVHIPAYLGSRGKPFFWNSEVFFVVSADCRLVQIHLLICIIQFTHVNLFNLCKFVFYTILYV
jgi:hypothetical protein